MKFPHQILASLSLFGAMATGPALLAAQPNGNALIKLSDEGRLPDRDVIFDVVVADWRGDKEIRKTKYRVSARAGGDQSLVDTLAPARQAGRKLLMKGDDLWFYTPDIKRPTRVSMQQRLTGEVANGDIARTNFAKDYEAKLEGKEKIGKQSTYRLELIAKRPGVTYGKIRYWVSADKDTLPVQAEFFATSGKLLKRAHYDEPKPILGRRRISRMTIEDAVESKRRSLLIYSNHKAEALDASLFNKDSLAQ